ncbi:MAG: helix-turn-helix transcriptional regulator [Pseudomonadota bacterium]
MLAFNLRRLRTAAGLSQEELASRAELHRTYVSSVERGQRNVSVENIFRLADALQVPAEELVKAPSSEGGG